MDLSEAVEEIFSLDVPPAWSRASPGAQLKAARRNRSVSQRQLADAAELPQSYLSRIESGLADPPFKTWERLYSALGCQALIVPIPDREEALDLLDDERLRREDRMEAGRARRW